MPSLFVLETPWEDDLESTLSVGPFLLGLRDALRVRVVPQRFNRMRDLEYFLRKFSGRNSGFSHCYIACHGTRGRLQSLIEDVNSATIVRACRRARGRGFIIGACAFGNTRTAEKFLRESGAHFVAGYSRDVPWVEGMIVDLLFLSYLFVGRCRTRVTGKAESFIVRRNGSFAAAHSQDPLKVARWVYEDLPLAKKLGFVVHRRRPGKGPAVISKYPSS